MKQFLFLCAVFWAMCQTCFGGTLNSVEIVPASNATEIVIGVSGADVTPHKLFTMPGVSPRLVLDMADTQLALTRGHALIQTGKLAGAGHILGVRFADQGAGQFRIVFDLTENATLVSTHHVGSAIRLMVSGPVTRSARSDGQNVAQGFIANSKPASARPAFIDGIPVPRVQPRRLQAVDLTAYASTQNVSKNIYASRLVPAQPAVAVQTFKRLPTIVIDPGHGGRDPGAIGIKGTHEKKITLSAAKELQRQLRSTGRYNVVLTRDDDRYVEHEDRLMRARMGQADLFISIHADSTKSSKTRGASVYTLADRAKKRSKNIIDTQNWIMDVDLSSQSDPVGDILVDLAQRKTQSQSTLFADHLVKSLGLTTQMVNNSHRRAGYYVLLAPDVPAVLLELGFLSNVKDEALLRDAAHRKILMRSVVSAINSYFDTQKP